MDHWRTLAPISDDVIVTAVVLSPAYEDDRTIYVGTSAGLHYSRDGGGHWERALPEAPSFQVQALAMSHRFDVDGVILMGGVGSGVLRSIDGGQSWSLSPLNVPSQCVTTTIAFSPSFDRDGIALLGTLEDGIFRSTDGGRNWVAVNFGLLSLGVLALVTSPDMASDKTAYAITEDGIYLSPNEGRAWKAVSSATVEDLPGLCMSISPDFAKDSTLFVGAEAAGVWRSMDRGQSWQRLSGLADRTVNALCFASSGRERQLYAGTAEGEVLVSEDGGESWQLSMEAEVSVMALASQGSVVVAGLYDRVIALQPSPAVGRGVGSL